MSHGDSHGQLRVILKSQPLQEVALATVMQNCKTREASEKSGRIQVRQSPMVHLNVHFECSFHPFALTFSDSSRESSSLETWLPLGFERGFLGYPSHCGTPWIKSTQLWGELVIASIPTIPLLLWWRLIVAGTITMRADDVWGKWQVWGGEGAGRAGLSWLYDLLFAVLQLPRKCVGCRLLVCASEFSSNFIMKMLLYQIQLRRQQKCRGPFFSVSNCSVGVWGDLHLMGFGKGIDRGKGRRPPWMTAPLGLIIFSLQLCLLSG